MKYIKLFSAILIYFLLNIFVKGQETDLMPVDQSIKIGNLENGFKYYIRYNKRPEKRVELRLVVKAGSVLEDELEQGLAHFVEHMCFNGTVHFEKNTLIKYLQSLGIDFGPEINAYTSFNETVYMLSVPSDSLRILNSAFQVMEDWAAGVTFDPEEVEKEKGIIIEEWRMGRGASQRLRDKTLPVILKNSKYAERLPIGKKEIIETATREKLVEFYNKWYRPDLMALIVVGDIDVNYAENKIKEHFNKLILRENIPQRKEYDIPDHKETLVTIAQDKEYPYSVVYIYNKLNNTDNIQSLKAYRKSLIQALIVNMLNQRLEELASNANPPFIQGFSEYSSYFITRNKSAFTLGALTSDTTILSGLKSLLVEYRKAYLYGFSEQELERSKKILLKNYEIAYKEKDKTESSVLASEYIRNFLYDEPIPGIEFEYNYVIKTLPNISIDEVNNITKEILKPASRVVVINAPVNESVVIPDSSEILSIVKYFDEYLPEKQTEKIINENSLVNINRKGKIKKKIINKETGITELILSNNVKVVLYPTNYKNDEILFNAESFGGESLLHDSLSISAKFVNDIINECGIGKFSKNDLQKILAGKSVNINPNISLYSENISGSSSNKDIETLFQLIYLYFTSPREDSTAFTSYIKKIKAYYKNILNDPVTYAYSEFNKIINSNHPRILEIPNDSIINLIKFNQVFDIYKNRFNNASDFTFVFVGSFKIDSIIPLIEEYLATLPSKKVKETYKDLGIRSPQQKIEKTFNKGTEPKSYVFSYFCNDKIKWNEDDAFLIDAFRSILEKRYIDILREEKSGVYTFRVKSRLNKIPFNYAYLQIIFPCAPENTDSLFNLAKKEIQKIQREGVTEEEIKATKESYRRRYEKQKQNNSFWLNQLINMYLYKKPIDLVFNPDKQIDLITSENIKRISNIFDVENYIRLTLYPEKYKKEEVSE